MYSVQIRISNGLEEVGGGQAGLSVYQLGFGR